MKKKKPEKTVQETAMPPGNKEIVDLLLQVIQREKALAHNLGFLTDKVNNLEIRVIEIQAILEQPPATGGTITNIGEDMPTNLSIVAGTTGVFMVTWNGAMLAGAPVVWTASDPAVLPVNDPSDPTGNTSDVPVPASDTATTFVLTASGTNSVNAPVTATATITITPAPPAPATGGTINQLS